MVSHPEPVAMTVRLSPALHEQLRQAAFERKVPLSAIIRHSLENWLDENGYDVL